MRMRIISAAVVLGMGIVGITLAQQKGEEGGNGKARLRAQVAKLRADVELRQLEHEVEADILKKLMTDMKNLDGMEALKGPMEAQLKALMDGVKKQLAGRSGIPSPFLQGGMGDQEFNMQSKLDEATAKVARPLLDAKKKEFVQKASELNEKRLELAEVEKRYNEAK